MESTNCKKREGQQLQSKDMPTQRIKKIKTRSTDFTSMFLIALSSLSERKKLVIKELGFGSILEFSCHSNIDEIFSWLVSKFDVNSATLTLEDQFSFTFSTECMHVMLGFPKGSKDVISRASEDCTDYIHNLVQMETPTVEYLCSLLSNQEDEETFTVIFMVLIVTVFIDPISGVPNPSYYPNFIHILSVKHRNWCSFSLDCLLKSVSKHMFRKLQDIKSEIGVYKFLLVIPYLEFLITPEFALGSSLPRLPLWTTSVVNYFIALDSKHGQMKGFGRLSKKHISSTPFKGCKQLLLMPAEILDYINLKFKGNEAEEDKKMVQNLSYKFFQKYVQSSIPIVNSYVDDLLLVSSSNEKYLDIPSFHQDQISKPACSDLVIHSGQITSERKNKYTKQDIEKFLQNMFYFRDIHVPEDNFVHPNVFRELNFSEKCSIKEEFHDCDLPIDPEFESRLIMQTVQKVNFVEPERAESFSDLLNTIKEDLFEEIRNCGKVPDCKFSFEEMRFLLPGEEEKPVGSPIRNMQFDDQRKAYCGLSLNERQSGKRIPPIFVSSPSFSLEDNTENKISQNTNDIIDSSGSDRLKEVDPLFYMALDQFGKEIMEGATSVKLFSKFSPTSKMGMTEDKKPEQSKNI